MDNKEVNKKSMAYKMGSAFAGSCVGCIMAILIALTIKLLQYILF